MPLPAPRNLMDFVYFMRRYDGAYVNSQYTGIPGSSLSQYILDQGPAALGVHVYVCMHTCNFSNFERQLYK